MSTCDLKRSATRFAVSSSIKAKTSSISILKGKLSSTGNVRANNSNYIVLDQKLSGSFKILAKENVVFNINDFVSYDNSKIRAFSNVDNSVKSKVSSISKIRNSFVNKLGGPANISAFIGHSSLEKLYPIEDITVSLNGSYFVNEDDEATNLYDSIDEGVLNGSYDNSTYIYPSSVYTEGTFRYKCKVTTPNIRPEDSYLVLRATSPLFTDNAGSAPLYKLSNIRFEDPSGNIIVKYKDINIRGDADYTDPNFPNYTTYVTEPEINNSILRTWEEDYPSIGSGHSSSIYTLNIDFDVTCLDDPFDQGFNIGYEEKACDIKLPLEQDNDNYLSLAGSPLSAQTQGFEFTKTNSLRITALELTNSGSLINLIDNYLRFYVEVPSSGFRVTRNISPSQILEYDYDTGIYPDVDSKWISSPQSLYNSGDSLSTLTHYVRDDSNNTFITLNDPQSSGKLKVKFSIQPPVKRNDYTDGEFNIGYLVGSDFNTADYKELSDVDNFLTIDSVELKVVAKKEIGVRDFSLDVVGYSDDKLLNVTSSVGGFLQNIDGSGNFVATSGFADTNYLALSSTPLSEQDQYFEASGSNNAGGDHYKLSTSPIVSGTEFQEYTIPLNIYEDNVTIGKSTDYSMSSYFENLYLDIYPIPSGASISRMYLTVSYKPSNAISLHTIGQADEEMGYRNVRLFPSSGFNVVSSSGNQLSLIENIPHGFATSGGINGEFTLKTNYSRRWRGTAGDKVISGFNTEFDYSFDKDFIQYPFINYYDFNNVTSSSILPFNISDKVTGSSLFASGAVNVVDNLGARFKSDSLFNDATDYQTIDWTSIAGYENDALYGKINDAFDSAIRVSGDRSYLYNYNVGVLSSGFAAFIRFSPDIDVSGVGYNLFNSGVLFAQQNSDLSYALAFDNGYLTAYTKDTSNNIIKVSDTATYDQYSYPLSAFITYNENGDDKLRLYTDNEFAGGINLRGISSSFDIKDVPNNPLTVGYSPMSGVGMNMFVSDFGISYFSQDEIIIGQSSGNDISSFFEDLRMPYSSQAERYKLWQRVDNDTDKWHLGAFSICPFNHEFDRFTFRVGSDYIFHYVKNDGSAYNDICDLTFPETVSDNVSYHTQIENDFIRFNLNAEEDVLNGLYSPRPRIHKNLPRGYNFEEEAFVVDTIIENDSDIAPKLIVSLYTINKDPLTYPAENYGLINRHIHQLESSGCWQKISSTFDSDNFFDEISEPWANFNSEKRLTEFNHKYFSKDIQDMFVQYDLVYPSGSAFESTVKIHAINVRLDKALVKKQNLNGQMNLVGSGGTYTTNQMNLAMPFTEHMSVSDSGLILYNEASILGEASGIINLHVSGSFVSLDSMPLYVANIQTIDNTSNDNILSLYTSGQYFDYKNLNLYTENKIEDQSASGTMTLFAFNKLDKYDINDQLNLYSRGASNFVNFLPNSSMNLYVDVAIPPQNLIANTNLFVKGFEDVDLASDSLSLFTVNYNLPNYSDKSQTVKWTSDNFGVDIELDDNSIAFLDADDEIRGVDITCYGNCNDSGICEEAEIITHDTVWNDSECVDGGIFRASNVYTNLEASGFKTDVGYSGHFYGIRKYVGLIPDAPYLLTITGKTADGSLINVPREIDEVEYGTNDEVAYSGTKLIGDSPYSVSGRQEGDEYGKSISIDGDLMAIGAPKHNIYDAEDYELADAGTVFVYRRDPAPSGYDWEYSKADWKLETKLTLPSDYLRDYVRNEISVPFNDSEGNRVANVTERVWRVGQEGRQFGHSVDVCNSGEKQIIAVGGPSVSWLRTFEDLEPSGVNIGLFVFTDEFRPEIPIPGSLPPANLTYKNILSAIKDKDLLFKYFSSPFPVKFNVKIMVCDVNADSANYEVLDFPEPKPEGFVYKKLIHRHRANEPADQDAKILSGIKDIFDDAFPYDTGELNNNIPALLGFFVDNSSSLGINALQPALNNFIDYYQDYAFASGLTDFYNVPSSGGYAIYEDSKENWILESIDVLNHVLDTGRLVDDNQFTLFTSGITTFNADLNEFNDPPPSGGAVYIFEKEGESWDLIQTIESPTESNIIAPDRFGHAVKISKNADVIIVGSPYIDEAITVYQYDSRERERMYNNVEAWVDYQTNNDIKGRYSDLKSEYGKDQASRILYTELTANQKYDLRSNYTFWLNRSGGTLDTPNYYGGYYATSKTGPIQEYEKIFSYGYGSIPYQGGTWRFLLDKFAPTSRLGYSVAIDEDGKIIAAGAPTDSFNEYDDTHKWAMYHLQNSTSRKAQSNWYENINAGAVRLFESREYFPHNLAIEYGKFGNLHYENRGEGEDQYFDNMEKIYNNVINQNTGRRIEFTKTPFAEVDIPEEAGLVFIITPAVDALSDEIMTNIKEWLALGDRHLVLVGNDPRWEDDGAYADSNRIINDILAGLNSRMRIFEARNEFESLQSDCPEQVNVIPSVKPSKSRSTYVNNNVKMFANGVGDIRLYYPGANSSYACTLSKDFPKGADYSFQSANGKCKMPMVHQGDLRAEWYDYCSNRKGDKITFAQNWAMFFGTVTPDDYGCYDGDDDPPPVSITAGYDPVPLLVAAEYPEPVTVVYPAVPAQSSLVPVEYEDVVVGTNISASFGDPITGDVAFAWSENDTEYNSANLNIGSYKTNPGQFFNPPLFNAKDPLLQARAVSKIEIEKGEEVIYEPCNYVAREQYKDTSSNVVLIAGLQTESQEFLNAGTDTSRLFYANIIKEGLQGNRIKIAQLGEWTGRTRFTDAYDKSFMFSVLGNFSDLKNSTSVSNVFENVSSIDLAYGTDNALDYDICWIANPIGLPNEEQLEHLETWLNKGNKKIIITYEKSGDNDGEYSPFAQEDDTDEYTTVQNVKNLCQLLDLSMKPIYLPEKQKFALNVNDAGYASSLTLNPDKFISKGFDGTSDDNIDQLPFSSIGKQFVPINAGNGDSLAYTNFGIKDKTVQEIGIWQMKTGTAEVTFPVIPGSGYKVFVDMSAEDAVENYPIQLDISDCSNFPKIGGSSGGQSQDIIEYNENDERIVIKQDSIGVSDNIRSRSYDGTITTKSYDIQVANGVDEISMYLSAYNLRLDNQGFTPTTSRLIGISGCLIEIESTSTPIIERVPTKYDWVITSPAIPERTETYQPPSRPISTNNTKYCPGDKKDECAQTLGGQLIADGPVVVAQELEQFSSFEYGENRSRITVISDPSLIQGRCIVDENDVINQGTISFLQSLYPPNPSNFVTRGRKFTVQNKIMNPERLTPQKLFSSTGNDGHNLLFYGDGLSQSGKLISNFIEDQYNPAELERPYEPWEALPESNYMVLLDEPLPEDEAEELKQSLIDLFDNDQYEYGATSKFSGVIEGNMYSDASYKGGLPAIITNTGYDYLDLHRFPSGYHGDLFGYSISLHNGKLVVGTPFAGFSSESLIDWNNIADITAAYTQISGTLLSYNGGAGAAYIFEKTGNGITPQGNTINWECVRKLRPETINVGQDLNDVDLASSGFYLGDHNYNADDLLYNTTFGDQFGQSVAIDGDTIVISAPGHDFENYIEESGGAFITKAFGSDLNISTREVFDVGESGFRNTLYLGGSGTTSVLNNGAIYVFENRIYDWINKEQRWELVEKITQQGYNSRLQLDYTDESEPVAISGSENDLFGSCVAIDRARRTDGDYTIVASSPYHKFATSGNHGSEQPLLNAGAAYTYDIMLREKSPSKADPNAFIQANVFGSQETSLRLSFENGENYNERHSSSGIVYSNNQGEIFLEASGQDPVLKGFIKHRPFIESVIGGYMFGKELNEAFRLYVSGQPPVSDNDMQLFTYSENGNVYNTLGLYENGVLDIDSGNLTLYTDCPSGITISESGFYLYTSGIGLNTDTLNLRIRGK